MVGNQELPEMLKMVRVPFLWNLKSCPNHEKQEPFEKSPILNLRQEVDFDFYSKKPLE